MNHPAPTYRFGDFVVDTTTRRLVCRGEPVAIEPTPFDLLVLLLANRQRVVGKEEILDAVWNGDVVSDSAVSRAIARLRNALGDDARQPRYVATVHGRGFRFVAEVEEEVGADRATDETAVADSSAATEPPILQAPETQPRRLATSALLVFLGALAVLFAASRLSPGRTSASLDPSAAALDARRVAVLPIRNLSRSADDDYFAKGLTDQLSSVLTKIDGIRVVGRAALREAGDEALETRVISRELGAGSLLEGTVRRSRERLRVTVRLIDANTHEHLWAQEYDRTPEDWFEVQSEIAIRVAQSLKISIPDASMARLRTGPTRHFDAYDLYLKGLDATRRHRRGDNEIAIEHYQRALELDPDFAMAKAGLAGAYALRVLRFGFDPSWMEQAEALAEEARALDPDLPETYRALAFVAQYRDHWSRVLEYHEKALALDPDYHEALFNAASAAWALGQWDKAVGYRLRNLALPIGRAGLAIDLMEIGFEEEGRSLAERVLEEAPTTSYLLAYAALRAAEKGDFDEARQRIQLLQRSQPEWARPWGFGGLIELYDDKPEAALPLFEKAVEISSGWQHYSFRLAQTQLLLGEVPPALEALAQIEESCQRELASGAEDSTLQWLLAAIHSIRGDSASAVAWLEKAVDAGHRRYWADAIDPAFAPLTEHPEFRAQLLRMEQEVEAAKRRVEPEVREWWVRFRAG